MSGPPVARGGAWSGGRGSQPREGAAAAWREGFGSWGLGRGLRLPSAPLFRLSFKIIRATNASPGLAKDICVDGCGEDSKP